MSTDRPRYALTVADQHVGLKFVARVGRWDAYEDAVGNLVGYSGDGHPVYCKLRYDPLLRDEESVWDLDSAPELDMMRAIFELRRTK